MQHDLAINPNLAYDHEPAVTHTTDIPMSPYLPCPVRLISISLLLCSVFGLLARSAAVVSVVAAAKAVAARLLRI